MESKKYYQWFQNLPHHTPPNELPDHIVHILMRHERTAIIRYLIIHTLGIIGTLTALVVSGWYVLEGFIQSGFLYYINLLWSWDGLRHLRELFLVLLESVPIIAIAGMLLALAGCLGIIGRVIVQQSRMRISVRSL